MDDDASDGWEGARVVHRHSPLGAADPAETYHEASKLHPALLRRQMAGVRRLDGSPALRAMTLRPGKRFPHRPAHRLPPPAFPAVPLEAALLGRRSSRAPGTGVMSLAALAALLFAASGVTRHSPTPGQPGLRAAPSAGALYPLDTYVIVRRVEALPAGLFHYDPDRHALTGLDGDAGVRAVTDALIDPASGDASAVLIFVACFPRSRIKYGLRAYRFVLLEAGHVAQNVLLAASALGLAALPIGGFYDRRIEDALSLDGLHESPIYLIAVGSRVDEPRG